MNPRIQFAISLVVAAFLITLWFLGTMKQIRRDVRNRNNR
jgi:hypothetical protein